MRFLSGESGIGKETIIQHLAFRLTKDEVPEGAFRQALGVDRDSESGRRRSNREELECASRKVVEEIVTAGNIILYIPDIHNLVKSSGTAYLTAADALMPIIKNNAFPVSARRIRGNSSKLIEPRSDFVGAFDVNPRA